MRSLLVLWFLGAATCLPDVASAQLAQSSQFRPELLVGIAWGHLFRFEDRTFGDRLDIGAGVAILYGARLGVELHVNRMVGLSLERVPCAFVGVTCVGTGHEGVRSASNASANVLYYLTTSQLQPYLTAGIGVLWTTSVSSTATIRGNQATFSDQEVRDSAFALNLGAGIRFGVGRHFAIRPEVRFYDATLGSRMNLSLIRASMGIAYRR